MNLAVVLLSLLSVTSACSNIKCQLSNGSTVVVDSLSLCCNGQVIPKDRNGQRQSCCCDSVNGTQQVFNPDQEICCEGKTFPRSDSLGQTQTCCGTTPYVQQLTSNLCCVPHPDRQMAPQLYTSSVGRNDTCCGNIKYDIGTKVCCTADNFEVRIYPKDYTKICCQSDYISSATHECALNEDTGRLITRLKFIRPCGNEEIDNREDLCCNGNPHRNVQQISSSSSCCGAEIINTNTHHCCPNAIPIPRNMQCCGSHPNGFNPRTHRCCNGTPVEISHYNDQCCGTVTMDTRTHGCCNDQAYDKLKFRFCRGSDNKCSAVGIFDRCCGSEKLNQLSVCCKAGTTYNYRYFQTLKTKSSDNGCCTSYTKGSNSSIPYSDQTQECRQGHEPTVTEKLNQPKCGRNYFDENTDLCCNNNLYRDAVTAGQECCQYNVFNPETQSCCVRGRVYNSTSCPYERCGNRHFVRKTQLCCDDQLHVKLRGRKCCGKQIFDPRTHKCCGSKVVTNPNQCRKPEHPICMWLCEQDDKIIRRQIRIGNIDICKTNAYVSRIGRKSNFKDVTRIQLEGERNRLYHHNQNSLKVRKLFHPTCACDFGATRSQVRRKIVVITDKSIRDIRVDLTDSDYILPYTAKIRRTLMKYWKERCNTPASLVTADVVDEIFDFIKVKIEKQKESQFYES